jgi:hypothetical protein
MAQMSVAFNRRIDRRCWRRHGILRAECEIGGPYTVIATATGLAPVSVSLKNGAANAANRRPLR